MHIISKHTGRKKQGRFLCILPSAELRTKLTHPESQSDALVLSTKEKTGQFWENRGLDIQMQQSIANALTKGNCNLYPMCSVMN